MSPFTEEVKVNVDYKENGEFERKKRERERIIVVQGQRYYPVYHKKIKVMR